MTKISNSGVRFGESLLRELSDLRQQTQKPSSPSPTEKSKDSPSFMDHLEEGIKTVNDAQKFSDKKSVNLATGKEKNIHETMLAASQAELSFNLMVQIRNKAIEAYQEIMRMPV